MEIDLFENEQRIYDNALNRMAEISEGEKFDLAEFAKLTEEYGKLLKQLRRSTRLADRIVVDLHAMNLDLTDKVYYDVLTGVFNRRYMDDNLKRIIRSIGQSGGGNLSILLIDIDYFKKYNDTYGHGEGDTCLKTVTKAIAESVMRPDDFVARYGGEEFVVILPNTDENGARIIADRILRNVRSLNIPHKASEVSDRVTVSIGATTAYVDLVHNGSDYIKRADEALYVSKGNGRNQYTYHDFVEAKHEV
jgi:diguanylate cyclase (GGDEF)-like protein